MRFLPLGKLCRRVLSLPPSVRLSVRLFVRRSVRRSMLVCAITRQGFDLEAPFSHRMCILGPFSTLLKMGSIDLDLQGNFGLKLTNLCKSELVCTIIRQGFNLESSFSHRMRRDASEPYRKWGWSSLTFKVIFKCLTCHISGTGWSIDIRRKHFGFMAKRE